MPEHVKFAQQTQAPTGFYQPQAAPIGRYPALPNPINPAQQGHPIPLYPYGCMTEHDKFAQQTQGPTINHITPVHSGLLQKGHPPVLK